MEKQSLNFAQILVALLVSLGLSGAVLAQGGSGDLPTVTVPKSGAKTPPGKGKTPPAKGKAPAKGTTAETKPGSLLRAPANVAALTYSQLVQGALNAQSSGRTSAGHYFNEYTLNAKAVELLTIQFLPDPPTLRLQVTSPAKTEILLTRDAMTGDYKFDTPSATAPVDGEYRFRVIDLGAEKAATGTFALKVVRTGLTPEGYAARLQTITSQFKSADVASVESAINQLETLALEDPNKVGAFELLGVIYVTYRNDLAKAFTHMEQAIRLGGAAQFKVSFDGQWRKPRRSGQNYEWEDVRTAWLRIQDGRVNLAAANAATEAAAQVTATPVGFTLMGPQIRTVERASSSVPVIAISTLLRRTFQFMPATRNAGEADLIIKLLQTHVVKKTK